MVAILAKKFMKSSIIKSLEFMLYEKAMFPRNHIKFNQNQHHSIESCVVDIFNIFLGNSKESKDFYSQTLPFYFKDHFNLIDKCENINGVLIKDFINPPNLLVSMQYHCGVYFLDCLNVNFEHISPFVTYDIKYISSYLITNLIEKCPSNKKPKNCLREYVNK